MASSVSLRAGASPNMNTPTIRPKQRRRGFATTEPLRVRAEFTGASARPRVILPSAAEHDFLVPNPRPDLTTDLQTLRMIEVA